MYAYTYTYINTYTYRNYKELDVDGPVLCSPSETPGPWTPNPTPSHPPSIPAPCNRARFRNFEIVDRTVASTRGGRTRRSSCPWQHTSLVEKAGSYRYTRRITHSGGTVTVWATEVWIYSLRPWVVRIFVCIIAARTEDPRSIECVIYSVR